MKQQQQKNCWQKRNKLEKILVIVVFILLCFLLSLFIILLLHLGHLFKTATDTTIPTLCTTPQCIEGAAQIIDLIDPSVDPCDNFYQFSCGGFLKKAVERDQSSTISKLKAATLNKLEALITQPTNETLDKPLVLQRKFYTSCMNTTAIDEDQNDALIDLIVKLGEWPIRQDRLWNTQKFDWLKSILECRHLGVGFEYFMRFTGENVTINGRNIVLLTIRPPVKINIPTQFLEYYIDLMTSIALQLGATNKEYAKIEFNRVLQFEEQIKLFIEDEVKHGQKNIAVQVGTLQTQFPDIKWVNFLNNITITSVPFSKNTWVHFRVTRYLPNLMHLLRKTPKTTQANYIIWKIVESYGNYLNEEHRTRYNSFLNSLNPGRAITDRRKFCLQKAKLYFPSVAEVAYLRKYVTPEIRDDLKMMTSNIKKQLIDRIRKSVWLDNKSKKLTEIMVNEVKGYVGASERVYNEIFDQIVDMKKFHLNTENVIEMTRKLYLKTTNNYFRIINRDFNNVTKEALDKTPIFEANAMYMYQFNILVLFAPFLQDMVYNFGRPLYMNYGAIGSVIGHELAHSLISRKNSHEDTQILWPSDTTKKYEERLKCLLDDYRNYTESQGLEINAKETLSENLADLLGPNLAYEAFHKNKFGQDKTLPGLDYTPNQIFWIMFGALKCHQPRPKEDIFLDPEHGGPPEYPVLFSVKNSPHFAADFNCPIASNMNPGEKCQVF